MRIKKLRRAKTPFLFFVTTVLFVLFGNTPVWAKCSFADAKNAAMARADSTKLIVFDSTITPYREYMKRNDGTLIPRNRKGYKHTEIQLWFLDTDTCEIIPALIERKIENGRPVLINKTPDITVDIEDGPRGKIWNGYNTPYYVPDKTSLVIIMNLWLQVDQTEPIRYSPFSLKWREAFPELAKQGLEHYQRDAQEALSDLRGRKTLSRAFPGVLLAEVAEKWFGNVLPYIPFIEQSDHRWFEEFENGMEEFNPYRRVAEIIGANGEFAYNPTRSSAGAAGLMQIYLPTCEDIIRKDYSLAGIPPKCGVAGDYLHSGHIEGIKSAIAHLDFTLKAFMDAERGTGFFGFINRNFMNSSGGQGAYFFQHDLTLDRSRGKDVSELQKRLNITADGIFGTRTKSALIKFQNDNFDSMFALLEGNNGFLADLGERQVAAYNSSVIGRVIPSTRIYLDKWDQTHLERRGKVFVTPTSSLVYETVMYLRIYRYVRDNPDAIFS